MAEVAHSRSKCLQVNMLKMNSREAHSRRSFKLYFVTKLNIIDQMIFITKIYNKIQNGRALLTYPRSIKFNRSQPANFLELLQLYYNPFITSSMIDAQHCSKLNFNQPAIFEFIKTALIKFKSSPTKHFKQDPLTPLLQELFSNSYLYNTILIRNPADQRL